MAETGSVPFLASSEGMPFLAFGAGAAGRVWPPGGRWVEPECVSGLSHLTPTPPLAPPGTIEGRGIVKGVPLGKAVELRRPGASLDGCEGSKKR